MMTMEHHMKHMPSLPSLASALCHIATIAVVMRVTVQICTIFGFRRNWLSGLGLELSCVRQRDDFNEVR